MGFRSSSTPPAGGGNPGSPAGGGGPRTPFSPRPRPFPSRGGDRFNREDKDGVRLNERIRVPEVRLIDEKGEQVGIVPTQQALAMARDRGLDLMEVAAGAKPPVCKILDYGKFKYEEKKKEHIARKNQVVVKVKEIQLRPNTDAHDLDYKVKNAISFVEEGDKVKFIIQFRGREVAHTAPGYEMCKEILERMKEVAIVETPTKMEGKKMMMIVAPNPQAKKK